jgi:hypothetical protein
MAGPQYSVSTGTTTLTAPTGRVLVELPTGASMGLTVVGLEVFLSAASAGSCQVEWCTFVTTGVGTTVTANKFGTNQGPAAVMGTIKVNDTTLPGTIAASGLPSWVLPLPGSYSMLQPLYREMWQPVSTLRCIRVTSTVTCECRINVMFEQ